MHEKKRRLHVLTEELKKTSLAYNESFIGKTVTVLVDKPDKKQGYLSGRTEGKVLVRFQADSKDLIGQFVKVNIESVVPYSMEGKMVETIL
jgi:tRNA-2-methylthio-N6-dimethylallyladenosine synthase